MTMNERLYAAGLLEAFYRSANKKDRSEMIAVLMSVEFDRQQAEEIADSVINNPAFRDS